MAQINVTQFAKELGLPPDAAHRAAAGGRRHARADRATRRSPRRTRRSCSTTCASRTARRKPKQKITLTRKQTTEIKKSDGTGKSRTIQVEVRKKRVLVKRDAVGAASRSRRRKVGARRRADRAARSRSEAAGRARRAPGRGDRAQGRAGAAQEGSARRSRRPRPSEAAESRSEGRGRRRRSRATAAAPAAAAKRPAAQPPVEGTLHKPAAKPGEKRDKPKKAPGRSPRSRSSGATSALKRRSDQDARRRGRRPGLARAQGGPARPSRRRRAAARASPRRPSRMVRDIVVPETITVADLAHKMSREGRRGHQGDDEARHDGRRSTR